MQPSIAFTALAILAAALAGCTADVNTEGLDLDITVDRIRVNGEAADVRVESEGTGTTTTREKKVEIETTNVEVIDITIVAKVVQTGTTPPPPSNQTGNNTTAAPGAILLIIVQDKATSQQLAQRRIEVQETTTETINVNVKGKDNVVVITRAEEGSADVNVSARGASSSG